MSKEGRNRSFSQGSLNMFLEEQKKRKRTGEGRTGRKGEEIFKVNKKTAGSSEV
jgi:hypothetical protein